MVERPDNIDVDALQRSFGYTPPIPIEPMPDHRVEHLVEQDIEPNSEEEDAFKEMVRKAMRAEAAKEAAGEGASEISREAAAQFNRSAIEHDGALTETIVALRMRGISGTVSLQSFLESLRQLCRETTDVHAVVHEILFRAVEVMRGEEDQELFDDLCAEVEDIIDNA